MQGVLQSLSPGSPHGTRALRPMGSGCERHRGARARPPSSSAGPKMHTGAENNKAFPWLSRRLKSDFQL